MIYFINCKLFSFNSFLFLCFAICSNGKTHPYRTCDDLWEYHNIRISGSYQVDVDEQQGGLRPFNVECDMSGNDRYSVKTIVHHDSETTEAVKGYEAPGSYLRNVSYKISDIRQIETLIDISYSCQQYIRWDCKGAMFGFWYFRDVDNWWVGRGWQNQYYWGGAETDSKTCGCFPYCYATVRNSTCNCDANLKLQWLEDSGLLLDSKRLPVLQLRFGDTGESYEAGQYTLGPLECRAQGHKVVNMGSFIAPITIQSPGYPYLYPPAFHHYNWKIVIKKEQIIELVFPNYEVIHFGAYNSVPNCRYVVEVDIKTSNGSLIGSIKRGKSSAPYYISDGRETIVNLTLTTCNQNKDIQKKDCNNTNYSSVSDFVCTGFVAEFRKSECGGCNVGFGKNGSTTHCTVMPDKCATIASFGYPFPHYIYDKFGSNYSHSWKISTLEGYIIQIEFNDFDIISTPGLHLCNADLLTVFDIEGNETIKSGTYCNINKFNFGNLASISHQMVLHLKTTMKRVGNSRGFQATIRALPNTNTTKKWINNIAEGKSADQSSTKTGFEASLALDGNLERKVLSKCTATNYEHEPWWRVNLQKRHRIYGVQIYSSDIAFKDERLSWPIGQYGLPMPVSGCPSATDNQWKTGLRFHDVKHEQVQDDKFRYWSQGVMLKGGSTDGGIVQQFCIQNAKPIEKYANVTHLGWMPGKYCIFQVGDYCPDGFTSGAITWFDKSNTTLPSQSRNHVKGTLPKGVYTPLNTTIYFCCREDGNPDVSIRLPKDRPFYLLQYGDECQKVEGMSEIEHFFHYEEEIQLYGISLELIFIGGTNQLKFQDPHPRVDIALFEKGLTLHYCYYDISDQLKGFQVLVDTTPDTYGFSRFYDDNTGISRAVDKPFLSAVECASFDVTSTDLEVITLNCNQPIEGQYVIIFMNNRFDSLRLCEVKVFGEEACGRPLGMATEEILDLAISSSSFDDHGLIHHHVNARLNNAKAWCAAINDVDKYIQIDLLYGEDLYLHKDLKSKTKLESYVTVVGIAMQGMDNAFKNSFVTQFQLLFSNDTIKWTYEEEPIGRQKVYKCVQCESQTIDGNEIVMYNLLKPIITRYVRVKVLTFKIAPCLRLEIIGCRDQSKPCEFTLTEPTGAVFSPNYPFYYAQYKSCLWHINPGSKHVELDFIIVDLATKDRSGGKCHDSLFIIPHHPKETAIELGTKTSSSQSTKVKLYPKKFISNGAISLHLKTCFRFSISRFQGFFVKYKTSQCPGCGIGDYMCGKVHNCVTNCGRILSINYPLNYINNHRCQWLITAPQQYYVNLTVEDFDVPNTSIGPSSTDCIFDHVSFTDVATGTLIGRYCNAKKPPKYILSNWNKLLIEFNTDSNLSGRGFSFTYVSQKFNLSDKLAQQMIAPEGACPENWSFFRGYCYNAFTEKESLQWYQSEEKCAQFEKGRDGHLVSITDQHEMQVVHYLLNHKWKVTPHQSIYIGLIDTNREGFYNWSDGNPMSYTDWSYGSDNGEIVATQPDGGAFEDCTVIKLDSSHSTANWHDIPCSLGKRTSQQTNLINSTKIFSDVISSYICKMDSSYSTQQFKLREPLFTNVITDEEEEIYRRVDDNRYFVCENLEVISNLFRCDGTPNCRDGSDETFGCDTSGNSCLESQFKCANGRCIAIGMYCDFVDDCGDGSDEMFCERRQCKKTEFRCNNHQCIPLSKRCDLLTDCKDLSDEGFACTLIAIPCNLNTTFQCYYGNCIPLYALCDRHRDCPGKFHEDEQASRCQKNSSSKAIQKRAIHETNIWHSKLIHDQVEKVWARYERSACFSIKRRTCQDLQIYENIQTNGTYYIQPEGHSTIGMTVECHFFAENSRTVIHHDSETKLYVRSDIDGPATYTRTITYQYSIDSIVALINHSNTCKQYISWQCSGTGFKFSSQKAVSYWVSRQGVTQLSWGGAPHGRCECYPNCTQPNLPCNCDSEIRFEWQEDSGYITDKNKLPVSRVVFGDTYKLGQSGYFYVGPLECDGNADDKGNTNSCRVHSGDVPDFKCQSGQMIDRKYRCIYEFDQLGYQIGCRDVSHLRDCETYQCPADYVKCTDSYCIPPRYICNGKWDCVGGSDEVGCARYMCPGQYKCANESSCVLLHQLCDGIRHCPLGDDEWFCNLTCPENCTCIGLLVDCRNANLTRLPVDLIPKETRKLELSNNALGPHLAFADFSFFGDLGELILQRNDIQTIKSKKFLQLTNLYKLDLSWNNIQVLESAAFAGLKKVTNLILDQNPNLSVIEPRAFVGLTSLRELNISVFKVQVLHENVFLQMSSLQNLSLRSNGLKIVEKGAFNELTSLVWLDIRDNNLHTFPKDMFHALKSLRYLSSDSFKFCCLAANIVPFERCLPPQDEISDCEDLMSNTVQRIILWFLGVVALLANAAVVVWRCQTRHHSNQVSSTMILSLGCADFLMGIYLIIIASVDEHYRGRYIENSDLWKNSILCSFCGFISTISSEVSVTTLVFITIDRLICISFPFSSLKFTKSFTYKLIAISWTIVIFIAGLPLLPISYFNDKFYARSGTCLALHITSHKHEGWEYSVAIFLCVNFLAFLIIVGCYGYMYKTIRLSARKMNKLKARQVRETQWEIRVGRQMALIVVTNFLCWFPVIVMGLMSLIGFTISGAVYSWTAVFVFPLNSATNPIIYSLAQSPFSLFAFKHKRDSVNSRSFLVTMKQKAKLLDRESQSAATNKLLRPPPGYIPLLEFLSKTENLKPKHLLEISHSISELIKQTHESGYALGNALSFENVYVSTQAFLPDFNAYPVRDTESDDFADDMEEFGILVKRILRIYHIRISSLANDSNKSVAEVNSVQQNDNENKEESE